MSGVDGKAVAPTNGRIGRDRPTSRTCRHALVPTLRLDPLPRWVGAHQMAEVQIESRPAANLAADVDGSLHLMGADKIGSLAVTRLSHVKRRFRYGCLS
jgi:hypothetical protein